MTEPRTAVVTGGAGGGIGHAITTALADAGWHVVIGDIELEAAETLAASLRESGKNAVAVRLDVSDEANVTEVFTQTLADLPQLRGLVNSAGVGLIKPIGTVTTAEWDRLHGVDLRGAFLCSRAAMEKMIPAGGGAIVNIGSVQALGPAMGFSAYCAAKLGMVGLTRGIAADHGRDGIRCSIIHPGLVDSPQNRDLFEQWGSAQEFIDQFVWERQMIPRPIQPEEIGAAAAFLLSDEARSITAAELVIDAGTSKMAFDNTDGSVGSVGSRQ